MLFIVMKIRILGPSLIITLLFVSYLLLESKKDNPKNMVSLTQKSSLKGTPNITLKNSKKPYSRSSKNKTINSALKNHIKTNLDFQRLIAKEISLLKKNISSFSLATDETYIKLKKSELFALQSLEAFKLVGFDNNGKPKLALKDISPRKKHIKIKHGPKHSTQRRTPTEQSLLNLNLPKFSKLLKKDKKKEDELLGTWNSETKLRNTFLDMVTRSLDNMGLITSTPTAIHKKNLKMMSDILQDAYKRPKLYKVNRKALNNITDLELPVHAETIKNTLSAKFGLIGGTISGTMSNQLLRYAKSAILVIGFEAIKGISFDSLFMAIAVNLGIKQIYALNSYYKHIEFSKAQNEYDDVKFDYKRAKDSFDSRDLFVNTLFQKEMQKSWILGHFAMTLKDYYTNNQIDSKFFQGLAISTFSWIGTPSIIPMFFALTRLLNTVISGKSIAAFLHIGVKKFNFIPSWFSSFIGGPWKLLSLPIDIATQSAAMFSLIHMRLHGATLIFENVFPHPATIVHLTQTQKFKKIENFSDATKKVFLPICRYFASINNTDESISDSKKRMADLMLNEDFSNQLTQCIELKLLFSSHYKVTDKKIQSSFKKEINYMLKNPRLLDDEQALIRSVSNAYTFPEHYKVLWLTAVNSIVKNKKQEKYAYALKNVFFLGSSDQKWFKEYFRYHIFELKSYEDLRRLDEMLLTITKKNKQTYFENFKKFFSRHKLIGKKLKLSLKSNRIGESDTFVTIFWQELKALKESFIFAFKSYSAPPSQFSYKKVINEELIHYKKIKRNRNIYTN